MKKFNLITILAFATLVFTLSRAQSSEMEANQDLSPFWKNAVVYFAMTDRFFNGDETNDLTVGRKADGSLLRGFHGGDIRGLIDKINDGYFDRLGVQVLWMTPVIENIHGPWIDEWGTTYAYHGYWPKDWTRVDPNFGTEQDLKELFDTAHQHNMRVLLDVVINHVGPPTQQDSVWPADWVRRSPNCDWKSFDGIANCTMVPSLPDVITEKQQEVEIPEFLQKKWQEEGRLKQEMSELNTFFNTTGYAKTPQNYLIKWLTDWVRDYGADGFRVDTAKHVGPEVWQRLKFQAEIALQEWRDNNPQRKLADLPFYMVGEVMEWGMLGFQHATEQGRAFDYGDRQVDFFDYGFDALINMGFATHAYRDAVSLFELYANQLNNGALQGKGIINYITSHDDIKPFDRKRQKTFESATKLMLSPGAVQITFGDELARNLVVPDAIGDEWLRTPVDWSAENMRDKRAILHHWQQLGQFRAAHPAVGAGKHRKIDSQYQVFSRTLQQSDQQDVVVIGLALPAGEKTIPVAPYFSEGEKLVDGYSGQVLQVKNGQVQISNANRLVLLAATPYNE
ncbi:alpha-amylase family glycosyl hydrolase [Neptunicella sp. SCSIO 80796]|uniref:alpha-amylase family glycosyl hydrolase n=1 Tax=Neptunicella plasticusilytica TaxID=3117012 RepID=UPI003A4DB42D